MTKDKICEACFGTGQEVVMRPIRFGAKLLPPRECPVCGGTGLRPKPANVLVPESGQDSVTRMVPLPTTWSPPGALGFLTLIQSMDRPDL